MKITIITSPFSWLPPNGFGAVERRWYQIGQEIGKRGHSITFISKKPNSDNAISIHNGIKFN